MKIRPLKTAPNIEFFSADPATELRLPFLDQGVSAGFPSPAQDYMDLSLDLNKELIKHPQATFFGRVRMPVVLDRGTEKDWLASDLTTENQKALMTPFPESRLNAYPVDRRLASRTVDTNTPAGRVSGD
jgi:hypothetical protein